MVDSHSYLQTPFHSLPSAEKMMTQEHAFDITIILGFGRGCADAIHFALVLLHDVDDSFNFLTDAFL